MPYAPTHYTGTFANGRCVATSVTPGRIIGEEEALIDARIARGGQCPECGCASVESNGSTEYRCVACDHRWGFEHGERYGF